MVFYANTIVNPWAVMVISFNTDIANGTMPGSTSPNHFAIWTQIGRVEFLK